MAEIILTKSATHTLIAGDNEAMEVLAKWKAGDAIRCKVSKMRNPQFHRKWFALVTYAFDHWEPPEPDPTFWGRLTTRLGLSEPPDPEKNFDRFRKDVTISCGYYDLVYDIKGNIHANAKSISFGKMDEHEFSELYEKTISFLLKHVIRNHTREDLDAVVDHLLGFA